MVAGAARVRVTFQVDADGLLEVQAEEVVSGDRSSIIVKPSFGLAEQDIAGMIQVSMQSAVEDKARRSLREKQVEAQRHLEALRTALSADGDTLLNAEERQSLLDAMHLLATAAAGDDTSLIERLTEHLNNHSRDFAARRMDAGIKAALAGQRLDAVGDTL
jgi:molecular chaperone HscA